MIDIILDILYMLFFPKTYDERLMKLFANRAPYKLGNHDIALPPLIGAIDDRYASALQLVNEKEKLTEYIYKLYDQANLKSYWVMYLELKTGSLPYFVIDSIFNRVKIKQSFKDYQEVKLEGDFGDFFKLFTPTNEHIDAVSIMGPDVMDVLVEYWQDIDLIVANRRIWLVTRGGYKDKKVVHTLIEAGEIIQKELLHRARTYKVITNNGVIIK